MLAADASGEHPAGAAADGSLRPRRFTSSDKSDRSSSFPVLNLPSSIQSPCFIAPLCRRASALKQKGLDQDSPAKLPQGEESPEDQRERRCLAFKTARWTHDRPALAWMLRDLSRQAESCRGPPPRLEVEVQAPGRCPWSGQMNSSPARSMS